MHVLNVGAIMNDLETKKSVEKKNTKTGNGVHALMRMAIATDREPLPTHNKSEVDQG